MCLMIWLERTKDGKLQAYIWQGVIGDGQNQTPAVTGKSGGAEPVVLY